MKCSIVIVSLLGFILVSSVLAQAPLGAPPATSRLDRSDMITAVGTGQPPSNPVNVAQARAMAIRSALLDAERNLFSMVQGMAVHAEATVGTLVSSNEAIRAKVEGVLKGARHVGQPNYLPDGSVEITIVVKRSDLANVVLPDAGFASTMASSASGSNTGLIIDARGQNLTPALCPRVLDDRGQEVYGPSFVTRDYAVRSGVAGYAKDPDSARKDGRSGANPLLVKGAGSAGLNRTDVTLSAEDAGKVRGAGQAGFLIQGKVIFVID
ncbi:MAG: hypothetical protein EXS64_08895 [Candidatus Latescibacteria bacterium]|nr:hypothetical protein [Candidatus Latescibacterota bacterium]